MKARQIASRSWRSRQVPVVLTLAAWFAGAPLCAQLGTQYTPPGTPAMLRPQPSKDEFKIKLENSPWKLKRLHVSPWLGLQDVSLVENLGNRGQSEGEDFTLTFGAGLRAYVPAGQKVIWAAHALPEYVWWQDSEAKRSLNGRYGLGLFVFFNRMTLELSQRRIDQQAFFSSEVQTLTSSRVDLSTFDVEFELTNKLFLFGRATRQERDSLETESPIFSELDREDRAGTIGLRYKSSGGWKIEISHVELSSDFATESRNLSNSGTSEVASLGLDRSKIALNLRLAAEDRTAGAGSDFGVFTETTGDLVATWTPNSRLGAQGYLRRDLTYSVDLDIAHILRQRQGASLSVGLGKSAVGFYIETGDDDFTPTSPAGPRRIDDVTAYGAALLVDFKGVTIDLNAVHTEYDSNLVGLDREVTTFSFSIQLDAITRLTSELIERLSLGRNDAVW